METQINPFCKNYTCFERGKKYECYTFECYECPTYRQWERNTKSGKLEHLSTKQFQAVRRMI